MFNPFRIFSLADEARRVSAFLDREGYYDDATLQEKVEHAARLVKQYGRDAYGARLLNADLSKQLAAANAKIERMTSGLRRGSKAKAVRLQDARAAHDAEA